MEAATNLSETEKLVGQAWLPLLRSSAICAQLHSSATWLFSALFDSRQSRVLVPFRSPTLHPTLSPPRSALLPCWGAESHQPPSFQIPGSGLGTSSFPWDIPPLWNVSRHVPIVGLPTVSSHKPKQRCPAASPCSLHPPSLRRSLTVTGLRTPAGGWVPGWGQK